MALRVLGWIVVPQRLGEMKNRLGFLIVGIILFMIPGEFIYASWQKNVPQKLIQPDGKILNCFATGDEYYNWLHDFNNFTIIQDGETGFYVYARKEGGVLVPTRLIPGVDDPAEAGLAPSINLDPDQVMLLRKTRFPTPDLKSGIKSASIGTLNNITVFIRFSDQSPFSVSATTYNNAFNGSGTSSARDFYQQISKNQLTINTTFYPSPSGSVVVSYQDTNPRAYFEVYNAVTNPDGYDGDTQRKEREDNLLKRSIDYVRSSVEASGLDLDYDNDNVVDNITFIVNGSQEGWNNLLWPHRWVLHSLDVRINNMRVWDYIFLLADQFKIGTTCHELSHALGAPDLYHYSGDELYPVGAWDLMEWNSDPPQQMGAYIKHKYFGWFSSIQQITNSGTYTLSPLSSDPFDCFKIASPNSDNEFFLVEYRKKEGRYESGVPGSGLIIYRINPTLNGNSQGPPDEVYAYRPNGTTTNDGSVNLANYSAETGRTEINETTNPSPFLTDGSQGGISISGISSAGSTISFSVNFATSGPDLIITQPGTTPTSANAGSTIDIACRLTNQGSAAAGSSTLRIYLSPNATYENSDVSIAYGNMGPLDPGSYFNVTGQGITIPATIAPGNYYVLFMADADGAVAESDENNNLNHSNFTVTGSSVFNPPQNLAANVSGNTVGLTWNAPSSGSSGSLSGFKVFRQGSLVSTITNSTQLTFSDSGLAPGTYTYYVTATYTSASGESGASNQVNATVSAAGLPDLVITNQSITPSSLIAGSTIDISCRLVNQGSASAGSSTIRLYVSTNPTFEPTDILLAYGDIGAVDAGSYLTITGSGITISGTTIPGTYYILFRADATDNVQESNENNNISFSSLTVNGTNVFNPPRNLSAGVAGTSVTLNWSSPVTGSSGTLSGFKVYRNGSVIATITNPAQLSYTNTGLAVGTYSYYTTATYSSVTGESGASNQVSATITASSQPDLAISNPEITPTSIFPGEDINVSCQLHNQGTAIAGASVIRLFLSANNTYDTGDVLLAYGELDPIDPGTYLNISGEGITIPSTTLPGDFFVLFVADATAAVAESNEANNVGDTPVTIKNPNVFNPPRNLSASVSGNQAVLSWDAPATGSTGTLSGYRIFRDGSQIQSITNPATQTFTDEGLSIRTYNYYVIATFVNPAGESVASNQITVIITTISQPDLIIINQGITPSSVFPGDDVDLVCRLQNQGNATADASVIRVYISENQFYDAADIQLASGNMDPINAGSYLNISGDGITIPSTVVPGGYYVLFVADADEDVLESNESNNVSSTPLTVNNNYIFNPPVNLRANISGNDVTLSWNPPAGGSSGTITGFKVYQNGAVAATIINGTETSFTLNGLPLGTYNYFITATYTSVNGESGPSNQVSAIITSINKPDLLITNQMIAPATLNRGESIDLMCRLENQGTATSGTSTIRIFLSANQTYESGDVPIAFGNMESINAGSYISISGDALTIPRLTLPGNYYILFIADADEAVEESNENNNISTSPVTVTISAGIEDNQSLQSIRLFPVPASDRMTVSYSGTYNGRCQITIFNISGSVVYSDQVFVRDGLAYQVDVRTWLNGSYFVRIISDKEAFVQQIIVTH